MDDLSAWKRVALTETPDSSSVGDFCSEGALGPVKFKKPEPEKETGLETERGGKPDNPVDDGGDPEPRQAAIESM